MNEKLDISGEEAINLKILEVAPQIHHRESVFVSPSTTLRPIALFLIPLRELFVSGIPVVSENKVVGKIGPQHILQKVIELGYPQCMKATAKEIMVDPGGKLQENSSVSEALRFFKKTNFSFSPITQNGKLIEAISIRDFLPLIGKLGIEEPVSLISNDLIFVSDGISIENTLRIMFKQNISKMAVKHDDSVKIIDDRSLLQFLFSIERNNPKILDTHIDDLKRSHVAEIPTSTSISGAADFLIKNDKPCAVFTDKIITPWDLVMKSLWDLTTVTDVNKTSMLDSPF